MKAQRNQVNKTKSQSKKKFKNTNATNTSISLMNKKNNKNEKAKTISINNSKVNSMRKKSNPKKIKNNYQNELIESNYYNNNLNNDNNYQYNDISGQNNDNINIYLNKKSFDDFNNNKFKNTNYTQNYLYESKKSNKYIESSNRFKKTLDRLLENSFNLVQKQNNILSECEILTKNASMNEYVIQNIYQNENKLNFKNTIGDYANYISSLLCQVKKNKTNNEINEELKKENNLLKNKLEMINIDKDDNIKMKDGEISTLKIILVSEINHILNFLSEIGYDNIPLNKMEITDITSQNLTKFFELIIKIIKQMKEIIQKKESMISKMKIDQNTLRNDKNENIYNKSLERLSFDYNNYNNGLKNYNFSVTNSNQKRKYNISFRNYNNNKNLKNDFEINNNALESNNNEKNEIINRDEIKNELDVIINDKNKKEQLEYNNLKLNNDIPKNKNMANDVINNDNKLNNDSFYYNKERKDNNYSYDKGSNKSYHSNSFIIKENQDIKNDENNQNINNEIELKN